MVTANYFWKETAPKAEKTTADIVNTYTSANNALTSQQAQPQKTFADTFADISKSLSGFKNPYLQDSPKTYSPELGTTQGSNWSLGQDAIKKQLETQATGDSTTSRLARSSFAKLADEGQRKLSEQSALSGRAGTGQILGDQMRYFANTVAPQKQTLEATLQAQEEQQATEQRQQGIANTLSFESQVQQAKQFGSKQDFDIWATKAGIADNEANRLFNAASQEIQNKFNQAERLSSQEYGLMKDAMNLEASALQEQLNRNNQMGIIDKQLEADYNKLLKSQEFAEKQQAAQLAQEYDIASKQMGLDQQKIDLSKSQIDSEIKIALERLGIDKSIMENDKLKQNIELAGILTQMDSSDEMAEYAATLIANSMQGLGIDVSGVKKAPELTTSETGKLVGDVKGVDIAKWYNINPSIDDAEKLAKSKDWATIAKEKGVLDLKNSGVDELSLDGDRVKIIDPKTQQNFYNMAKNKTRQVVNINGVPYMAIPSSGMVDAYGKATFRMVSLDGSGNSSNLKFTLPEYKLFH